MGRNLDLLTLDSLQKEKRENIFFSSVNEPKSIFHMLLD
jgi:hypothetical protein